MSVLSAKEIYAELTRPNLRDRLIVAPSSSSIPNLGRGEASVDLRLGSVFKVARRSSLTALKAGSIRDSVRDSDIFDDHYVPIGGEFILHPRHFRPRNYARIS